MPEEAFPAEIPSLVTLQGDRVCAGIGKIATGCCTGVPAAIPAHRASFAFPTRLIEKLTRSDADLTETKSNFKK